MKFNECAICQIQITEYIAYESFLVAQSNKESNMMECRLSTQITKSKFLCFKG